MHKEDKLAMWKERLFRNKAAYEKELQKMDEREALYRGTRKIGGREQDGPVSIKRASHVRNIVAEIVEAQVDSAIPMPKVTARRQKEEQKARMIEDFLRNELDRLPFEALNDMDERTTPIQGGDYFLVEWDSSKHTHTTAGELVVTLLHPKQVIPQAGVNEMKDMDYILLQIAQTKEGLQRKYGVNLDGEHEENPCSRGEFENIVETEDMVTQNIAYFRNEEGGIGRFSWVNQIVLEDQEDYQARQRRVCTQCQVWMQEGVCPICGGTRSRWKCQNDEVLSEEIFLSDGSSIPKESFQFTEGKWRKEKTKIPYYQPNKFPIALRKNVSVYGKVLGDSDVDKIGDQQDLIKKLGTKIEEKLLKGGSYVTFPRGVAIKKTDEELKIIELDNPQQKTLIDVINIEPNIGNDAAYSQQVYETARNVIGITDSFQGRSDPTAQSGKAREFAAAQSAGRLESKRVMKHAAYAELFQIMFQFLLAYADEPRMVASKNNHGKVEYKAFYKYDFLEQDASGQYFWNDEFLFSVDNTAALAGNRERMWQETRMNLQSGAFGNPQEIDTLLLFWTRMEMLHYPGAGDTKTYLEETLRRKGEEENAMPEMPSGIAN